MDDIYSFVKEAEPLKKIKSHARIVALMAQQTTECAYFIRDYALNKCFCTSADAVQTDQSDNFICHQGNKPSKTVLHRMSMARSHIREQAPRAQGGFSGARYSPRRNHRFPNF